VTVPAAESEQQVGVGFKDNPARGRQDANLALMVAHPPRHAARVRRWGNDQEKLGYPPALVRYKATLTCGPRVSREATGGSAPAKAARRL